MMEFVSFLKLLSQTEGFVCGFVVYGCFSQLINLFILLFSFILAFKLLQFKVLSPSVLYLCDGRQKLNGFKSERDFVSEDSFSSGVHQENVNFPADFSEPIDLKSKIFSNGFSLNKHACDGFDQKKSISCLPRNTNVADDILDANEYQGSLDEDQILDVVVLRNMVKEERKRANGLYTELEKERMAAASAAEEAMAMLLRLRIEKSAMEMEASQYKRIAEQKQEYDRGVIQGLQWMLMKHDEDRKVLEYRLKLCMEKLKISVGSGENGEINEMFEELFYSSAIEGEMENDNVAESQGT